MLQSEITPPQPAQSVTNWSIDTSPSVLKNIHQPEVNIAIYSREIKALSSEINELVTQDVAFSADGIPPEILKDISTVLPLDTYPLLLQDIKELLHSFQEVTHSNKFRLLLKTVKTNMCRKFHTDINDVRLLCTYSGPETLWLTDDNINRKALGPRGSYANIFID